MPLDLSPVDIFINNLAQNREYCFSSISGLTWSTRHKIFYVDNTLSSSLSPVSSDPKRVCLCENGVPKCANYSYIVLEKRYTSGEKFNLSVVLVGDDFGTVSGGVYANYTVT